MYIVIKNSVTNICYSLDEVIELFDWNISSNNIITVDGRVYNHIYPSEWSPNEIKRDIVLSGLLGRAIPGLSIYKATKI